MRRLCTASMAESETASPMVVWSAVTDEKEEETRGERRDGHRSFVAAGVREIEFLRRGGLSRGDLDLEVRDDNEEENLEAKA